jgi:uncharacterized membrane protein YfcA
LFHVEQPAWTLALLLVGAFFAGMVDAVGGGGGLVQIPVMFGALPSTPAATILGTNKLASIFGTSAAVARFAHRVAIPWRSVLPAAIAAFVLSYAGAMTVTLLPPVVLRPLVLVLLIAMAIYTYVQKDFGAVGREGAGGRNKGFAAVLLGGVLGFYDGFFGPGTGVMLMFVFVRFFGFDFLRASASAKVVNVSTNMAALAYFVPHGHVMWATGIAMACFNIAGSFVGTHLALRHGAGFVRRAFLVVVGVLILRFAYDTFS